jgi:hypothetical protein
MLSAAGGVGAATTLMIRAFAIIGPRRRLGVGCAGGLTFLVVAVSSCRRAAGMVVARAIPALVVIGPCRRRTDHEKAAHGQDGGPCCLFQSAEHNRPPFRVTDSRGWLFAPYSVTATDRDRSSPNSFVFAVRALVGDAKAMTFPGGRGSVRAAFSGSDGASPSRYIQRVSASKPCCPPAADSETTCIRRAQPSRSVSRRRPRRRSSTS